MALLPQAKPGYRAIPASVFTWAKDCLRQPDNPPVLHINPGTTTLLIPVNIQNLHWILCVVTWSVTAGTITYYDSSPSSPGSQAHVEDLKSVLESVSQQSESMPSIWNVARADSGTQGNGSDCGVFVAANALAVVSARPAPDHVNGFRLHMAEAFLNAALEVPAVDANLHRGEELESRPKVQEHQPITALKGHMCEICGQSFGTSKYLRLYQSYKHPTAYMCHQCGRSFKDQSGLGNHQTRAHSEGQRGTSKKDHQVRQSFEKTTAYVCQQCKRSFLSSRGLSVHRERTGHTVSAKPLVQPEANSGKLRLCPWPGCYEFSKGEAEEEQHIKEIHELDVYICPYSGDGCYQRFSTEGEVNSHMEEAHPNIRERINPRKVLKPRQYFSWQDIQRLKKHHLKQVLRPDFEFLGSQSPEPEAKNAGQALDSSSDSEVGQRDTI
ncbi:MAG: hypothetical protein Q9167_001417 [Letrouitia subvulpina]